MDQGRGTVTRVGFVLSFEDGWLGGINYFRNLLTALYALPERDIEVVIFTGTRTPEDSFEGFPDVQVVRSRFIDIGSLPWRIRFHWRKRFSYDYFLERLLKKHNIDVLSHSGWIGKGSSIPAIEWIPDFQHVRLPDFFSADEISVRDNIYRDMCENCATIILSSHDAQADLSRFAPKHESKSQVLQFVVSPIKAEHLIPDIKALEAKYEFSGKYFLLPNQFWKHKNHRVVIEALGLLHEEGDNVRVLTTGNDVDYRHPDYFKSLISRAERLGVKDDFCHLGLVPLSDLAGLMRGALAIINPSFFEGWSTTVEEAKSLDKRIILSDIPVHREQNPSHASFFPPDDARALAEKLREVWCAPYSSEVDDIVKAQAETDQRRTAFAKQYLDIVLNAAGVDQ